MTGRSDNATSTNNHIQFTYMDNKIKYTISSRKKRNYNKGAQYAHGIDMDTSQHT